MHGQARQPAWRLLILYGFQLGHFVSMYGDCFQVVCLNMLAPTPYKSNDPRPRSSIQCQINSREVLNIMEWIPVVFVIFKGLVLGTGMFFAIKWHYDQGKKGKIEERRAVLRAAAKVAAIFVLSLLGLALLTYVIVTRLSLDLGLS